MVEVANLNGFSIKRLRTAKDCGKEKGQKKLIGST
jgi:hypothetical protein